MTIPPRSELERKLERFIVDELLDGLADGRDPLTANAVDSLGMEQLAEYIDDEFGVKLADDEMTAENLGSIAAVAALIDSKRMAPG
ncbi:MAG TPA: hypothetical protein VIM28_03110 [Solirubrobacterales bacterium]